MTPDPPPRYSLAWLRRLDRATITPAEAGRVLGISPRTVINLVRSRELPGRQLGAHWHVSVDGLIRRLTDE